MIRTEPVSAECFARAVRDIAAATYCVADALTRAPITPFAPLQGAVGIAADVARDMPGFTAVRVADVSPAARLRFAETLEMMARNAARASDRALELHADYVACGSETGARNTLARANREAAESDRCGDRAFMIRRAVSPLLA